MIKDPEAIRNLTAFLYFMKGTVLIYNGQEIGDMHYISLFDKDTIDWNLKNNENSNESEKADLQDLMRRLYYIKKKKVFTDGFFTAKEIDGDIIYAAMENNEVLMTGIFGINSGEKNIELDLDDGIYINLIDNIEYIIESGILKYSGSPIIFEINKKESE